MNLKTDNMEFIKMKTAWIALLLICLCHSCTEFSDDTEYMDAEFDKNFSGTVWGLDKVERNGIEITSLMDFSKFRISFKVDNTYSIENYLPFLVREDGEWELDDPQYPFHVVFKEKGVNKKVESELNYFIDKGVRKLSLTFSPGHPNNSYTYTFKKIANDF